MAEGDERTRTSSPRSGSGANGTRRQGSASSDPRDDAGTSARATKRPVSTGRARAAKQAAPDALARLDELPVVTDAPLAPVLAAPTLPPLLPVLAPPNGDDARDDHAGNGEAPIAPARRPRSRPPAGTARRRGTTSEVPLIASEPAEAEPAEVDDADDGAPSPGLGGLVLPIDDRLDERPAPPPRLLLPTGRIPRVGEPAPGRISDLPLQGIEPVERSGTPGVIVVPELDPSGEIVRDGLAPERRTLRDRLEPILVRRPRPRVRRVTRVLRHIDTWSVFKVALVFNVVLYVVCLTAGVLLWNVAYTTGTIDNVEQFFEQFGWEHFEFHGGEIYHHAWIAGLFAVIGLTGFAVLLATVFNLITDLVGGIRLSVLEEEVIERAPRRRSTRVARERRPRRTPPEPEGAAEPEHRPVDRATGEVPQV